MSVKYLIVDDEKGSRDMLSGFLTKYCPDIKAAGEAENVTQAYELIKEQNPNLVFLDISMPGQNGFALLERFDRADFEVIFITAYEEYALRAIKSEAVDYLLKPIGITELKDAVSRAVLRIRNKRTLAAGNVAAPAVPEKITLPIKEGFVYVNLEDIMRCEADGGYTWIYFKNKEKLLVTRSLKEFEDQLATNQFVRVHHHHLINLHYVARYMHGRSGQAIMTDGAAIDISQRKRSDFLQRIGIKE